MADTPVVTTSKKFTLKAGDFFRSLIVAVGSAIVPVIKTSLDAGTLNFNWALIGTVALGAIIGYLGKNLFTPSAIMIKNPELAKEVKSGASEVKVVRSQTRRKKE